MLRSTRLSLHDMASIMESALFAFSRPLSLKDFSTLFKGDSVSHSEIRQALKFLREKKEKTDCGVELKEVAGAWQLRTKEENKDYLLRLIKGRLFQLSSVAMEVLSVVAYRGPCSKAEIDKARGVESSHLLKTLMEKDMIEFGRKDSMGFITYKTTAHFLEVFGLKNLGDLPSSEDLKELLHSEEEASSHVSLNKVVEDFQNRVQMSSEGELEKELKWVCDKISSLKPPVKLPQKNP